MHPKTGQRDMHVFELMRHCREMAELLSAAVGQLGAGIEEDATREAAERLAARLVDLERTVTRRGLH